MKTIGSVAIIATLLLACAWGQSTTAAKKKITMRKATEIALAKEPGKVKSKELEHENGHYIYSFDIRGKDGIHEVNVDAYSGDIVEDKVESPADEAKEKQQDKKQHSKAKKDSTPNPQ